MYLASIFLNVSIALGLPPGLLSAVCNKESGHKILAFNPNDGGTPSLGVCQVKEETARFMGFRGSAERLWHDPAVNIYYAGKYLKYQLDMNQGVVWRGLSAYNAGHVTRRNAPYVDTVLYMWADHE